MTSKVLYDPEDKLNRHSHDKNGYVLAVIIITVFVTIFSCFSLYVG